MKVDKIRNAIRRRAKRKRQQTAAMGVAVPFSLQRQSNPMTPLERNGCRTEHITLPDGSSLECKCELWKNSTYAVAVYDERKGITQITIQRSDRTSARDWRHLQQIKNEVVGAEREAVEIYPAESRKVDLTNTTHLWAFSEGTKIPFGMAPLVDGLSVTIESTIQCPKAMPG